MASEMVNIKSEEERRGERLRRAIDRLVEIKAQSAKLGEERAALEAQLLKASQEDLRDTKRKSVSYLGTAGRATAVMADSVKVVYPSLLQRIFGPVYGDAVSVRSDVKLTAPAARLLAGLWSGSYSRIGVAQVIGQLPCDDKAKELLRKKLKGANYETDRKNLMAIGGFDEAAAGDYAYFIAEAAVWDSFMQLMRARVQDSAEPSEEEIDAALKLIDTAIVVEQTPKVSVEVLSVEFEPQATGERETAPMHDRHPEFASASAENSAGGGGTEEGTPKNASPLAQRDWLRPTAR